jgi:hypothetical protein
VFVLFEEASLHYAAVLQQRSTATSSSSSFRKEGAFYFLC